MTSSPRENARSPRTFVVLGFGSTHSALDAEALLLDMGIDVTPIPAPSALSSRCGIALRLEPGDLTRALRYLSRADNEPLGQAEIEDV